MCVRAMKKRNVKRKNVNVSVKNLNESVNVRKEKQQKKETTRKR